MSRVYLNHPSVDLMPYDFDELNKNQRWKWDTETYQYCRDDFFLKYDKWILEKKGIDINNPPPGDIYRKKSVSKKLDDVLVHFRQRDIYVEHFKKYKKTIKNYKILKYKKQYYVRFDYILPLHDTMLLYQIENDDYMQILDDYFNNECFIEKPKLLQLLKMLMRPSGVPISSNQKNGEVE